MEIKRFFALFGLALAALTGARAADISCNPLVQKAWSDPTAWDSGSVPTAADDVYIENGCGITLNVMSGVARNLTISNGSLYFSTTTSTKLTLTAQLDIDGGILTMGTDATPMPASSSATLVLGNDVSPFGLVVGNGGAFSARGAAKSPAGQAVANVMTGATTLAVPDAQAVGWALGDTITIGQTERTSWVNETEERVITNLSSNGTHTTVTWVGGLSYNHLAANGIRVLNLTRNVVVRGPGAGDTAVFQTWFGYAGSFHPAYVEFMYLSVQLRPAAAMSVSSSSFHGGSGIFTSNEGGVLTFANNSIYKCTNAGITPAEGMIFTGNDVAANGSDGLQATFTFPGDMVLRWNHFYSNNGAGLLLKGQHNVMENNRIYANNGFGMNLEGDEDVISNNLFRDNDDSGIRYTGDNHVFVKNVFTENASTGLQASAPSTNGQNTYIVSNEAFLNSNQGYHLMFPGTIMVKSASYINSTWGLTINGSSITVVESLVGYTPAGALAGNNGIFPEIDHTGQNLVLKGTRVNPSGTIASDALLSYNQNFATGTAKVDGDFLLSSGASLVLENAQPSWRSTATVPVLHHGTDHTASVLSTSDANAVSQWITIRCLDAGANQWVVEGSESGTMYGPFIGGISNQNIAGQFTLTFTPDPFGGQRVDDRLGFLLLAASTDAGIRKQVLFRDGATLTAAAGAVFSLKGALGTPALMDLDTGATTPFTFVSSGSFTMENAAVRRMAPAGFQLSGTGGVSMSSVTFDTIGAAGGAYITARNLTSSAVLSGMSFDPSTVDANNPFSVRVLGTDTGLSWTFADYSGNRTGDASDSDPNGRLYWAGSTPLGTPASFAAAIFSDGLRLTWAAPAMPPAAYRGAYQLSYSSVSAGGPFTALASPGAGAATQDHLGLLPETTYYYRLRATDLKGNTGAFATVSQRTGDFSQPLLLTIQSSEARTAGVGWTSPLTVTFNKAMSIPAVTGAVSLTRVKDGLGNALAPPEIVGAAVVPDGTGTTYAVTASGPLLSNSTYELRVTTAAADPLGQSIASLSTMRFTTLMDRTVRNVVTEGTLGAVVDVPAGALSVNGYITGASAPPAAAAAATQKLIANSGDALRAPVSGSMTALEAFDAVGAPQAFATPVTVTFNYPDATGDGVVDGTSPPVKAKTLRVHWLDERTNTWQRLPSSAVDATARQVSARAPHFTAFALIGAASTELTDAHAFPNPWTPESGAPVTFSGLGDITTIRVFTPQGSLIKEWTVSDGSGQTTWDARGDDGAPAASGLYIYKITSGGNVVTGKLVVVR